MERSQFMTKLWKLSVMQSRDDILNEMHGVYMHRINELLAQQAKLTAEIQSLFDRHLEEADRYDARIQQQQFSKLARVRKKAASILMRVGPINSQSNVKQLANPMDVKVLQNELTEQNAVSGDKSSTLEGTTLDKVESHSESTDFFDSDSADNHRVKVVKMQSDFVAASPIIQSPTHETDSQRAKPLKYQMLSILPGTKRRRPHKCVVCGISYGRESALRAHMLMHQAPRQFRCECGKRFRSKGKYQIHRERHSGNV